MRSDGQGPEAPGPPALVRADVLAMALLAAEGAALLVLLWGLVASPLSFDEQWRAYYVSLGTGLWDQLDTSSAPFTAGWVGLEQAAAALAGTTEWGLRLPMALAVPATAMATYWLGRRWLRRGRGVDGHGQRGRDGRHVRRVEVHRRLEVGGRSS